MKLFAGLVAVAVIQVKMAPGLPLEQMEQQTEARVKVTYETQGEQNSFTLRLYRKWAPASFDRFINLAKQKYYDNQIQYRAIPGFVLDGNYAPPNGLKHKDDPLVRFYNDELPWLAVNETETKRGGEKQSNKLGTISFGQEDDGRTKSEIFINVVDNGGKLDGLGFWPFGIVEADSEAALKRMMATWVAKTMNFKYGDIFFAGNASAEEAHKRQETLMQGGNEFVDRQYPGMTKFVSVEVIDEQGSVVVL